MVEKVIISILNWNGRDITRDCLDSLFDVTEYANFEVVVIDNGSEDGSVKMLRREFPNVHLIVNNENKGFAKGHNQGIDYARDQGADQVLLLNNDVEIVDPDWLTELVAVTEADNKLGVVGCNVVEPDGTVYFEGRYFPFDTFLFPTLKAKYAYNRYEIEIQPERFHYTDDVLGAVFMISADVLDLIDGLDEAYSPVYREESDYCVRVWNAGFRVGYTDETEVVHLGGASSEDLDSLWLEYVRQRNIFRFILTNYPLSWILPALPMMVLRVSFFALDIDRNGVSVRQDFLARPHIAIGNAFRSYFATVAALGDIIAKRRTRANVKELVK